MTGKGKYRLFVTDPDAGQVACIATISEEGVRQSVHSQIALRLKVKNRQITEIEAWWSGPRAPTGPPSGAGRSAAPSSRQRFRAADLLRKNGVLPSALPGNYPARRTDVA